MSSPSSSRASVAALHGAAESLLLPLSSRAFETAQDRPIIRDDKAIELLTMLDFDPGPLARNSLYHTIICLRTRRFDAEVAAFLAAHPEGIVVNLGCGLDTRFERIDNGRARWIEIDLPEAIELRRKLLREHERRQFLAGSITDLTWLAALGDRGDRPVFVFAEGVLMFIPEDDVRRLVAAIAERLPGSCLLFDAVKPIEVWAQRFHPTLRRTHARLRWGLAAGRMLTAWQPALRLTSQWFYCEESEPRLGWYRLLRHVPWLGRTAWILRYDVAPR